MPLPRQQAKAAFNHILDNVLGCGDESPLKKALLYAGIEDMYEFSTCPVAYFEDLTYLTGEGETLTETQVRKGDKNKAKVMRDFIVHQADIGQDIGDGWMSVTQEQFDQFCIDPEYIGRQTGVPPRKPSSTPGTNSPSSKYSPVDLFCHGIKRDPALFPTLKDEKFNDTWHRSFSTQARAQDVMDVLTPEYKPSTPEEQELFDEKQKYVYAVLESKVLTDQGKAIVHEHEQDYNAQEVYKKLTEHHLTSTKAMMDSSTILSYITSARIGSGEWRGTTEGFIMYWLNQVQLYEHQVDPTEHFSDGQKRTMLENAVQDISELKQVKNNADLEKTKTGKALTFAQYKSLLVSAATAYDGTFKPKHTKHAVYEHEFLSNDDGCDDYGDETYDIDTPIATIQANAHEQNTQKFSASKKKVADTFFSPRV
jgi:hypothetical protein